MRSNSREYDVSLRDCLTKDQRTNARTPVVFRGRPIGATEDEGNTQCGICCVAAQPYRNIIHFIFSILPIAERQERS